jgi:hypothetical protein
VDDDDWVGVPPEGHHKRDPAREQFWRSQWPKYAIGAGLLMAVVVLLLVVIIAS